MAVRHRSAPGMSVRHARPNGRDACARAARAWAEGLESRVLFSYTATLVGTTATFTGTVAGDTLTIDQSGGLLRHNRFSAGDAGFSSDFDFNSVVAGDQTLSATDPAVNVSVLTGGGNDTTSIGTAA